MMIVSGLSEPIRLWMHVAERQDRVPMALPLQEVLVAEVEKPIRGEVFSLRGWRAACC